MWRRGTLLECEVGFGCSGRVRPISEMPHHGHRLRSSAVLLVPPPYEEIEVDMVEPRSAQRGDPDVTPTRPHLPSQSVAQPPRLAGESALGVDPWVPMDRQMLRPLALPKEDVYATSGTEGQALRDQRNAVDVHLRAQVSLGAGPLEAIGMTGL